MIGRLDEYISDMENGVFDYTNDGKCSPNAVAVVAISCRCLKRT